MPRPKRYGPRRCAKCGVEVSSPYRTYCRDCERQYQAEKRARRLKAIMAGLEDPTNEAEHRAAALIWQQRNEQMIIEPLASINPPPSGYAITAPGW